MLQRVVNSMSQCESWNNMYLCPRYAGNEDTIEIVTTVKVGERHGLLHDNAMRRLWLKEREQSLQSKAIKNEEGETKEKRTKSFSLRL